MHPTPTAEHAWQDFRGRLLRYVRHRVADPADAEDIVQEVLLRASSRLDTLRDRDRLLPWLQRSTRNAIVDHHRRRARRERRVLTDEAAVAAAAAPGTDPESAATARRELAACVRPLLATLPPLYHEAVRRVDLDGARQVDLAASLGVGVSTLKSRVQRGRRLLRDAFLDCCAQALDGPDAPVPAPEACNAPLTPLTRVPGPAARARGRR